MKKIIKYKYYHFFFMITVTIILNLNAQSRSNNEDENSDLQTVTDPSKIGNQDINVVSDLKGELTQKELNQLKKEKNKKKEKENNDQKIKKKDEEDEEIITEEINLPTDEQFYTITLKSFNPVQLLNSIMIEPFVLNKKLYLFSETNKGKNTLYEIREDYKIHVIEENLPFSIISSKIISNQSKIIVLSKNIEEKYVIWTKESIDKNWSKIDATFNTKDIDYSKNPLLSKNNEDTDENNKSNENQSVDNKNNSQVNQNISINMESSHLVFFKNKYFLFDNNRILWFSNKLTNWYPLISLTPWFESETFYPVIFKNKLLVFGQFKTDTMKKWESDDGLIWKSKTKEENLKKKYLMVKKGFKVFPHNDQLFIIGGHDFSHLRYKKSTFNAQSFEDFEKEEKKREKEEKEKERLKKIKENLSEEEKEKRKEAEKNNRELTKDFNFNSTGSSTDLNPDLVDEEIYKDTSKEIVREKKFIRMDNNQIELDSPIQEKEERVGIFVSKDFGENWSFFNDHFSNTKNVKLIKYQNKVISFGYFGTLNPKFIMDISYSQDISKWNKPIAHSIKTNKSIHRVVKNEIYSIQKNNNRYKVFKINKKGDQIFYMTIPIGSIEFFSQNYKNGFFISKNKELWFVNLDERTTTKSPYELPFKINHIESSLSAKGQFYFFVRQDNHKQKAYTYTEDGLVLEETFNMDKKNYNVSFFKDQFYLLGGKNSKNESSNDIYLSDDLKYWMKLPTFQTVYKKVTNENQADKTNKILEQNSNGDLTNINNTDTQEEKEKTIKIKEKYPQFSPRYSPRSFIIKDELYIIGGYIKNHIQLRDVWKTSNGLSWEKITSIPNTIPINEIMIKDDRLLIFNVFHQNIYGNFFIDFTPNEKRFSPFYDPKNKKKDSNKTEEKDLNEIEKEDSK